MCLLILHQLLVYNSIGNFMNFFSLFIQVAQPQVIQIQAPHQQTIQTSQAPVQQVQIQQPQQQTQVYQQVVTPAGVQNVPVSLLYPRRY